MGGSAAAAASLPVRLAPRRRPPVAGALGLVGWRERRHGHAARARPVADPGDHREVAGGDVRGLARGLDPDADLHRALADVVHAGPAGQVVRHVGDVPDHDLVHRRRHDVRAGLGPAGVVDRRLPRQLVEHLEEQPEPQVPGDALLQHHEPVPEARVARQGEDVLAGGLARAHGIARLRSVARAGGYLKPACR